jgi:putative ABC transport system permease protein
VLVPRPEALRASVGAARPWVRGALRRPGPGLLVVVGLLVMTVATVASLVAADSLETLFLADAEAQWGQVDVLVSSPEGLLDEGAASFAAREGGAAAAAWAPRLTLDGIAAAGGRREPLARVLGLGSEEALFGTALTGVGRVDVLDLEPDEVIVNARMARRIGVDVGDPIRLVISVPEVVERWRDGRERSRTDAHAVVWEPEVVGIADDAGVADLHRTANVLARRDVLQLVTGLRGKVSALHVAAREPGRDAAEELIDAYADATRLLGLAAAPVKEDAYDIAEDEGSQFRGILLTLAFLVVAAAVAVTINLVALLGEARSAEVAVLRALGATRRRVARLLTVEGAVYAVVAVLAGTLVAVPLSALVARALAEHFAAIGEGRGREQVALVLDARPASIVIGALLVLVVAVVAVDRGARRVAAMDIDAMLRGAPHAAPPEPAGTRRPLLAWSAGLLLLGMGLGGGGGGDFLRFLGLSLLLLTWWLRARRCTADRRRLDTRAALLGLAWCIVAPALLGDFAAQGVQGGFGILSVAGAAAVGCAVVLATAHLRAVMRYVRGYLPRGRIQAALQVAAAYAEHHRSRSATVAGVTGIVLFMVAAMAVLGSATDIPLERQRGGYDVVGTSVAPLEGAELDAVDGAGVVSLLPHTVVDERVFRVEDADGEEGTVPYPVRVARADSTFASVQGFGLAAALPGIEDAADALARIVATGDGAVIDRHSRPDGAQPGDEVLIDTGRGPRRYELVAVLDTFTLNTVFLGPDAFHELFRSSGSTMVLAAAAPGVSPEALSERLATVGEELGLVSATMAEAAEDVVEVNRTFTDVFGVLLLLGLVVTLVAVGALQARAARERRAAVAVLRSLGLRRRDIARAMLAEPLLTGGVGIVLGLGIGLAVLRLLFWVGFADLAFVVDPLRVLGPAALTAAVLLAAAAVPAWLAARLAPEEALRDLG